MNEITKDQVRQNVRSRYKEIALQEAASQACCSPGSVHEDAPSCCSPAATDSLYSAEAVSSRLGYSAGELSSVPAGSNLGLGCGNPQAIAAMKPGETVIDLGSGGGFDCFLASRQVGDGGRVIGIDMTHEMISKARSSAAKGGFSNTEFRLGEIEHLPAADGTADVIISNCVINLSPDKPQVFREAFRVLRPGGRLAVSDVVMTTELPADIKNDLDRLYSGCVSGASPIAELETLLKASGFTNISIEPKDESRSFIKDWVSGANIETYIVAAAIKAEKPVTGRG